MSRISAICRTVLFAAFAFAAAAPGGHAQSSQVSAPITSVHYDVTVDSAGVGKHQLGVVMTFRVAGTAPVILALPAWSPGHYEQLWFARRVLQFKPEANGTELEWHKVDYQTWEILPKAAGEIKISFRYVANTIDRAVAWTQPDFSFFNGTNLFMYPVGHDFNWGASVTVHTEQGWHVATGMTPSATANTYSAKRYHDLVDMPFFVGRFAIDSTRAADHWIRLAMYPAKTMTPARRDRILGWVQKFVPAEAAVFRDIEFNNYTIFLVSDTVVNGGGLEHQNSQMDEVSTAQLDAANPGLFSHEFFHSWNVKRLRPADMVPYSYHAAQPTKWLWVSEGITDYYAGLALVRGGITNSAGFYDAIANEIAATDQAGSISLSDASLSVWITPMDGTAGIYYPKGGLAGFLLDIMIRDASNNTASLDNVMRSLYNQTYKQGKGFTGNQWWSAVSKASGGKSFEDFRRRYIDGRDSMPLDAVLPLAGLRAIRDTAREPVAGFAINVDSEGAYVVQLARDGTALASGMQLGDIIVSVGDIPVRNYDSLLDIKERYRGTKLTSLPVVVKRGGETRTLTMRVRLVSHSLVRIIEVAASEKAVRIRNGLLHGDAITR
jgi:predicted metalloprotease with PDZ domain